MTATVNGGSGPDGPGERGPMKAGGTAPSVAPDAVQEALDAAAASPSSAVSGEDPEWWPAGGEGAARRFASGHPMLTGSLVLEDVMALPQGQLVEALELLERVLSWARAQQARGTTGCSSWWRMSCLSSTGRIHSWRFGRPLRRSGRCCACRR